MARSRVERNNVSCLLKLPRICMSLEIRRQDENMEMTEFVSLFFLS